MGQSVKFRWELGRRVTLKQNGLEGTVQALMLDRYQRLWAEVTYADNQGAIHSDWFGEEDIEAETQ